MRKIVCVGGGEWNEDCRTEVEMLARFGVTDLLVVAAAAASFGPARRIERAIDRFESVGIAAADAAVLRRSDATDESKLAALDPPDAVYLGGGSSQYLMSAVSSTPWWARLLERVDDGMPLFAAGAAAAACCATMLDERGGGFGVGLGLIDDMTVVPECDELSADRLRRVRDLTPAGLPVAWIPRNAAVAVVDGAVTSHVDVEWTRDGATIPPPSQLSSR